MLLAAAAGEAQVVNPVDPYGYRLGDRIFAAGRVVWADNGDCWGSWYGYGTPNQPVSVGTFLTPAFLGFFLRIYVEGVPRLMTVRPYGLTAEDAISCWWIEYTHLAEGKHLDRLTPGVESTDWWRDLFAGQLVLDADPVAFAAAGTGTELGGYMMLTHENEGAPGFSRWSERRDQWRRVIFRIDETDANLAGTIAAQLAQIPAHASTVARKPPRVTLWSPTPGTTQREGEVFFRADVEGTDDGTPTGQPIASVTVRVGGTEQTVASRFGTFAAPLTLAPGDWSIEATARNRAGADTATATFRVIPAAGRSEPPVPRPPAGMVWRLKAGSPVRNPDAAKFDVKDPRGTTCLYTTTYDVSPGSVIAHDHGEDTNVGLLRDWVFQFDLSPVPAVLSPGESGTLSIRGTVGGSKHENFIGQDVRFHIEGMDFQVVDADGRELARDAACLLNGDRKASAVSWRYTVPPCAENGTIKIYSVVCGRGWAYLYEYEPRE